MEGDLSSLFGNIAGFAERRNDVAHSILRALQTLHPPLPEYERLRYDPPQYALVPPLYAERQLDATHRPEFIYSEDELRLFGQAFIELAREVTEWKLQATLLAQPS